MNNKHSPLLRQFVRRVVRFEVNPLACGEVQSVQICAVNVACCSSKHIQEAIYDGHCLYQKKKQKTKKANSFTIYNKKVEKKMADYQFCT